MSNYRYPLDEYTHRLQIAPRLYTRLHGGMRLLDQPARYKALDTARALNDVAKSAGFLMFRLVAYRMLPGAVRAVSASAGAAWHYMVNPPKPKGVMEMRTAGAMEAPAVASPPAPQRSAPVVPPQPTPTSQIVRPIRGRDMVSEVYVPLAWAGITGAGAALITGAGCYVVDALLWAIIPEYMTGVTVWHWAGVSGFVGLLTAFWFWLTRLNSLDDPIFEVVEQLVQHDLNNDGYIGTAPKPPKPRSVPVHTRNGTQYISPETDKSGIDAETWRKFATAVLCDGVRISKTAITSHTSISQPAYLEIFNEISEAGWIEKEGVSNVLTPSGWDALARFLPQNASPTLSRPEQSVS